MSSDQIKTILLSRLEDLRFRLRQLEEFPEFLGPDTDGTTFRIKELERLLEVLG